MKLKFIGAIEDVTGSMTMIETDQGKILIDCGLYQGTPEIIKRNLSVLPFDPKEIKAIILTHAHLDHSGFIPRLIKLGFRGHIYSTKATMKLALVIMSDSARIMEKSENHPLHSFYETENVMMATSLFKIKKYHESFDVLGMTANLFPAGHILGASSVQIQFQDKTIVFSGDLGRQDDPLIYPPEDCPPTDILVMESTYGGKKRTGVLHDDLSFFLKKIKRESKVGIIASFAVARAQMLITLIHKYYREFPEEKIRVVLDGPMMIEANKIYKQFSRDIKLSAELQYALEEAEIIDHIGEWESLSKKDGPLLVITSSGMVTGGRIWRYLENWQHEINTCLFLPGYQAAGTAGRSLSEGKKTIHDETGKKIHWTGEVMTSEAFSSHADQTELISWIKNIKKVTQIYLIHGEHDSKIALKKALNELGYSNVTIAESWDLRLQ